MSALWNTVWAVPLAAWHGWRIRVILSRHEARITATLHDHLTVTAGVSDTPPTGSP